MLHVLKSVADFLRQTTVIDMLTASPDDQNLAMLDGATLISSGDDPTTQNPLAVILDSRTDKLYRANDPGLYVGCVFAAPTRVDGVRVFVQTTGTLKAQVTLDGTTWIDDVSAACTSSAWCTLRLSQSMLVLGIRVTQTAGATSYFHVAELDVRARLDLVPRPLLWPSTDRVIVCTNTTDLSAIAPDLPLVTVSAVDVADEDGEVGNFSVAERTMVFIGLHAGSDDQADTLRRWAQMALETATAPSADGSVTQGIPLRAYNWPLTPTGTNSWWASAQHDWLTTPAPVVRVGNIVTPPQALDASRGQVQLVGVGDTADVRADFTVGAWEFDVRSSVRTLAGEVAQVQHLHNVYLALESASQFRSVDNALL